MTFLKLQTESERSYLPPSPSILDPTAGKEQQSKGGLAEQTQDPPKTRASGTPVLLFFSSKNLDRKASAVARKEDFLLSGELVVLTSFDVRDVEATTACGQRVN